MLFHIGCLKMDLPYGELFLHGIVFVTLMLKYKDRNHEKYIHSYLDSCCGSA